MAERLADWSDLRENTDSYILIASEVQAILLNEIASVRAWARDELVFHGGTSLNVRWGSPRFSEDLDFMISSARFDQIRRASLVL